MQEVKVSAFREQEEDEEDDQEENQEGQEGSCEVDEEEELEMLTEECEELINRLTSCTMPSSILDEPAEAEEPMNYEVKHEKNRLEKDYLELCI